MLSIGILTIDQRKHFLTRLLAVLQPQLTADVEVLIIRDNAVASIGEKRNTFLQAATQPYCAFIDDDDLVSPIYIRSILDALATAPDCVGFKARRTSNGKPWGESIYSLRFTEYRNHYYDDGTAFYERTPNHLTPVKIDLARQVGFKATDDGEDIDYAKRLRPLLTSEVFVDDYLYQYEYRTPATRREGKREDGTPATITVERVT